MNQKYKSIIAAILAVWIFAMGFVLGIDKGGDDARAEYTVKLNELQQQQQQQSQNTTTPDKPVKPDSGNTDNSTVDNGTNNNLNSGVTDNGTNNGTNNNGTNNSGTADNSTNNGAVTNDPTTYTDEQIIEWMNYYVNLVKTEQNMSATKNESISVVVEDCSVPSLTETINGIVDNLIGGVGEPASYTFANGAVSSTTDSEASTSDTPFSLIPPTNKQFVITKEGVADANVEVDANGNVTYTVILVPEDTTLTSPEPRFNSTAIGYLNLAGLDISPAEISQADMHYPGSTVSVTVDSNDKVIKLYNKLPMTGEGKASIFIASGSAVFSGQLDETWEFTY